MRAARRALPRLAPARWRRSRPNCASPSSPMPGGRRSTAWCAPSRRWRSCCAPRATRSRSSAPTASAPCPARPIPRSACRCFPAARLAHMLKLFAPDAIHLVTEGPLGWAARAFCLKRDMPFTTAYHTRFPEYVRARIRLPIAWSYAFVRRFHAPSAAVLVVAQSIRDELSQRGFATWCPGRAASTSRRSARSRATRDPRRPADLALCRPRRHREEHQGLPRPRPARHQVGGGRRPAAQAN